MWYVDVIWDESFIESVFCATREEAMRLVEMFRKKYSETDGYSVSVTYDDD
jgi:uncharacterized lipoprotein YehR (DUF1307 family)